MKKLMLISLSLLSFSMAVQADMEGPTTITGDINPSNSICIKSPKTLREIYLVLEEAKKSNACAEAKMFALTNRMEKLSKRELSRYMDDSVKFEDFEIESSEEIYVRLKKSGDVCLLKLDQNINLTDFEDKNVPPIMNVLYCPTFQLAFEDGEFETFPFGQDE